MQRFDFESFIKDLREKSNVNEMFKEMIKKGYTISLSSVYKYFDEKTGPSNQDFIIVGLNILDKKYEDYVKTVKQEK